MKCKNCNSEFDSGTTCPWCGTENQAEKSATEIIKPSSNYPKRCTKCGGQFEFGTTCPWCGTENQAEKLETEAVKSKCDYPMKWYKFIKVILLVGAVMNLSSAMQNFSGGKYDGYANKVYTMIPGMRGVDIFTGVMCLALAILGVATWYCLKDYKEIGPKLLMALYISDMALGIIIAVVTNTVSDGLLQTSSTMVVQIGIQLSYLIYNYKYFKEREALFVN